MCILACPKEVLLNRNVNIACLMGEINDLQNLQRFVENIVIYLFDNARITFMKTR